MLVLESKLSAGQRVRLNLSIGALDRNTKVTDINFPTLYKTFWLDIHFNENDNYYVTKRSLGIRMPYMT